MFTSVHVQIDKDTRIETNYIDDNKLIMLDFGYPLGTTITMSADDAKRVIAALQTAIYDAENRK